MAAASAHSTIGKKVCYHSTRLRVFFPRVTISSQEEQYFFNPINSANRENIYTMACRKMLNSSSP
jgi:hypothetical protein